ncbi:hypothetical protein BT96DRAFT_1008089 [Gymnopus androsaceus JB14]|uniref:Uncharacterized protein n=1 Tax=Gymnopus androsaceus JB14 TaxID=1447944 RepID=A0A6A4GGK7_9AGAR|nr:hypothetical protein BT96DRAFT_1008089 [Gymnopus androsaceus JB14]
MTSHGALSLSGLSNCNGLLMSNLVHSLKQEQRQIDSLSNSFVEEITTIVQLETEFDDVNSMVDTLIQACEEHCREIARELEPLEARFFGYFFDEAITQGVNLTLLLLERMHKIAHQKAVAV